MNSRVVIKGLAATSLGMVLSKSIDVDYERWHRLGRDVFLRYQAHRFDRYMAGHHSGMGHLTACIVGALLVCLLYEGLTYIGLKAFRVIYQKIAIQTATE
jgi:hypothetical protein